MDARAKDLQTGLEQARVARSYATAGAEKKCWDMALDHEASTNLWPYAPCMEYLPAVTPKMTQSCW